MYKLQVVIHFILELPFQKKNLTVFSFVVHNNFLPHKQIKNQHHIDFYRYDADFLFIFERKPFSLVESLKYERISSMFFLAPTVLYSFD